VQRCKTNFTDHYGTCNIDDFIYPITHNEADKWLNHFIKNKLSNFGKYEDAMSSNIKFGYHSLLSAVLNVGLITNKGCIKKAAFKITSTEHYYCWFHVNCQNTDL